MKKRLYYLLPETSHAIKFVNNLELKGIRLKHIHAIANDTIDLSELPMANVRQKDDTGKKIENWFWDTDLILFFIALLSLLLMTLQQVPGWSLIIPISIMAFTFALGNYFINRIPNVHLDEFCNAMKHREILIMIDVPRADICEIQQWIKHHHPDAVTDGVDWTSEALNV